MNKNASFDLGIIKALYYRYKEYITPGIVIMVCIGVFIYIIPPQIQRLYLLKQQADISQQRIAVLSSNLNLLEGLNEGNLDTGLEVSSLALPGDKDIELIFQKISDAASEANVSVDDYGLDIGDVAPEYVEGGKFPSLSTAIVVHGNGIQASNTFLTALGRRFPLSDINSVKLTKDSAIVGIVFYFKPFPSSKFDTFTPLKDLNKDEEKLVQILVDWQAQNSSQVAAPSSSSGVLQPETLSF